MKNKHLNIIIIFTILNYNSRKLFNKQWLLKQCIEIVYNKN